LPPGNKGKTASGIEASQFSRYNFVWNLGVEDIVLDGAAVETWRVDYDQYYSSFKYWFSALLGAERVLFTALGLTDFDYQQFIEQADGRGASITVDNITNDGASPLPEIEIVAATL